jgi:hypothetical protein
MIIDDHDAWRAASLLIKHHHEDAAMLAAQHADEMTREGDLEGATAWRLILYAVEELLRMVPKTGERVN